MATTYPYLVNTVWGEDNAPRINLLNSQMKEIGIGIATGSDKRRYVSVIFGTVQESDNSSIQGTDEFVVGAEEETPSAVPLVTSTLYDDGGQYHVVGAGQTFSEIALAYGLSWYDLANLNGININTPIVVIEGDVLLIHLTSTATLTPTASRTPRPPTITPRPTYTEDRVEMIVQTLSAPDEPADPGPVSKLLARLNRFQKVGGILLVVISLIGLLILFFEPVKRK